MLSRSRPCPPESRRSFPPGCLTRTPHIFVTRLSPSCLTCVLFGYCDLIKLSRSCLNNGGGVSGSPRGKSSAETVALPSLGIIWVKSTPNPARILCPMATSLSLPKPKPSSPEAYPSIDKTMARAIHQTNGASEGNANPRGSADNADGGQIVKQEIPQCPVSTAPDDKGLKCPAGNRKSEIDEARAQETIRRVALYTLLVPVNAPRVFATSMSPGARPIRLLRTFARLTVAGGGQKRAVRIAAALSCTPCHVAQRVGHFGT